MANNYIHIPFKEKNKPIFRIISISRLLEMFDLKKNTLLKPKLWDDPFENFVCKSTFQSENGKTFKFPFRNRSYGQCWTLKNESDAMWRIYAPNKDGAKIETTIKTLFDSLRNENQSNYPRSSCFIGKVKYYKQEELQKLIVNPDRVFELMKGENSPSEGHAKTLLLKRKEFNHEEEVRLLYLYHRDDGDDIYQYPCDPFKLVTSITLDPRMDPRVYEVYKTFFTRIEYEGNVDQSKLYSIPQLTVAYKSPDFK
ncbi:MAG: hypothetical protein SCARUB_00131 [Candidatus Scalindua rubra]|uniref:DUF2971 domain-containing protein n=1 Tax=Candidatus Scalindua rubra TaxID=1872076 RepID=A0A1E3XGD5_9BACT|nr:MAG: hypothetical protein SCARUB_00131 [Candidatus Scalindua rubra]